MPTFYAGQPDYIAKLNELDGKATVSLTGTSTDNLTLSVGTKSFTTDSLLQLHPTSDIKITRTSDVTKYMYGTVTTYNQDTGAMVVDVQAVNGSGTFSDWTITSSGQKGATGNTGARGLNAKGVWNGDTAYVVDDWVTYLGSSYYRKVAGTTGTTPDLDTTNWGILAQKGDAAVGAVTSVTASTPLASTGGTTPNLTIPQSDTSTSGFLSSDDWNTFNNKQSTSEKDSSNGYVGLTLFKINFTNALGTIKSFFTNANTSIRTYTFKDRDGTIADDTDLALKLNSANPNYTGELTGGTGVINIGSNQLYKDASGNLGVGAIATAGTVLSVGKDIGGLAASKGINIDSIVQSDVVTQAIGVRSSLRTVASSFTLPTLVHFSATQGTFGAGSIVSNQYGYFAGALSGASTNISFYGNVQAAPNNWNLFMNGSAKNYVGGRFLFETTVDDGTSSVQAANDISVITAGRGIKIKEGSNAKMGVATLVAGSAVVANSSITANSRIFLTSNADGGTVGTVRVSARIAGTSFTITSSSGADTSTIAYMIFEPV